MSEAFSVILLEFPLITLIGVKVLALEGVRGQLKIPHAWVLT